MDEGVQPLLVVSLRVDEFLLNDELLAIVEDVHYKVRGWGLHLLWVSALASQGCFRAWATVRRFFGFLSRSPLIRSLASNMN